MKVVIERREGSDKVKNGEERRGKGDGEEEEGERNKEGSGHCRKL